MINNWDLFSRIDDKTGNVFFSLLIDGTESDARLIIKKLKGYAGTPVSAEAPFVYSIPLPSNLDETTQDKIRTAVREGVESVNKVNQFVPGGELGDPLFNSDKTRVSDFPTFISLDAMDDSSDSSDTPARATIDLDIDTGEKFSIKMDSDAAARVIDLDAPDTPSDPEPEPEPVLPEEEKTIENMLEEEHIVDEEKEQTSYIPATDFGSFSKEKTVPPPAPTMEQMAKAATMPAAPKKTFFKNLIKKFRAPKAPDTPLTKKDALAPETEKKEKPAEILADKAPSAPETPATLANNISTPPAPEMEDQKDSPALQDTLPPIAVEKTEPTEETQAADTTQEEKPALQQGNLEIPDFTFTQPTQPVAEPTAEDSNTAEVANEKSSDKKENVTSEAVPFDDHDMLIKDMEGTMLDNMPIEDIFAAETKLDMFVEVENTLKTQQDQQQREEKLAAATEQTDTKNDSFDIFEQKIKEQTSIIDLNDIEAFLNKTPQPVSHTEGKDEKESLQVQVEKIKVDEEKAETTATTEPENTAEPIVENTEEKVEESAQPTAKETLSEMVEATEEKAEESAQPTAEETPSKMVETAEEKAEESAQPAEEETPSKMVETAEEKAEESAPVLAQETEQPTVEEVSEEKTEEEPAEQMVTADADLSTENTPSEQVSSAETVEEEEKETEPTAVKEEPQPTVEEEQLPTEAKAEDAQEEPLESSEKRVAALAEHTFRVPSNHAEDQDDLPEIMVLRRNDLPQESQEQELSDENALPVDAEIKEDEVPAETATKKLPAQEALQKEETKQAEENTDEPDTPADPVPGKSANADEPKKDFIAAPKKGKPVILQNKLSQKTAAPIKPLATGNEKKPVAAPISLARKDRMEDNKQRPILKIKPKTPTAPFAPAAPGTPLPPNVAAQTANSPVRKPLPKKPTGVPAVPTEEEEEISPAEKTRTIDHSIQIPLSELKKHSWPLEVPLNPTYTLSNMIMSVNRFAHATAISVIESPGKLYNPLVFHGDTGTGKTHFLNAMAYAFSQKFGQTNIFMTNGVRLSRGIQRYIMEGNIDKFEKFISTVQVLLIDDIHLLAINEQNRAYISKLLNTFLKEQKQIVITSKYPPESLEKLEELIKFKLDSGWISELKPATGSTHVKIVKKMLMDNNVDLNDSQVTDFFVSKYMTLGTVMRSIRRLKVLENLIPQTVNINQRSQAAIFEKLLASRGEDETSRVRTTDPTTITSITPTGNGEWGKIGFFYPANCSDKMNWMVYALQERAKELGLEGGFEIVVRSSYATENIISSAFKIANLCDNKKLKGAVILGPKPDTCDPSVKENFYDILTHMLEIMLIRCGIINYETLRQPSTYVKLISELMR